MPDEENSHTKTSHIMFFKQQVLRFAAPIIHSHTREQLKEWIGDYKMKLINRLSMDSYEATNFYSYYKSKGPK